MDETKEVETKEVETIENDVSSHPKKSIRARIFILIICFTCFLIAFVIGMKVGYALGYDTAYSDNLFFLKNLVSKKIEREPNFWHDLSNKLYDLID